MIPVTLFNANTLGITVTVNSGPGHWIGGTNAVLSWAPQNYLGLTMDPTGPRAPDVFTVGENSVAITPKGSTAPTGVRVTLPGAGVRWTSLQLYVFFDTTETANWLVLDEGQYITGGVALP